MNLLQKITTMGYCSVIHDFLQRKVVAEYDLTRWLCICFSCDANGRVGRIVFIHGIS